MTKPDSRETRPKQDAIAMAREALKKARATLIDCGEWGGWAIALAHGVHYSGRTCDPDDLGLAIALAVKERVNGADQGQ